MESLWPMDQHHSQSSPCDRPSRARTVRARKIVNFIQGSDTLSMKVMDDLSTTERWSLVEESTLLVLSFL